MALGGHDDRADPCSLWGLKRTSVELGEMSAYGPERTFDYIQPRFVSMHLRTM